jgi:hypothetical protein
MVRRLCLLVLGAVLPLAAPQAQTTFKCRDSGGRITYSNIPCEKQSLRDAGTVADRTTTLPLPALPTAQAKPPAKPAAKDEPLGDKPPAQVKPVVPLLEKLLK